MTVQFRQDTFSHILLGDVVAAVDRLEGDRSQTHRRELVRSIFAAVEGLHWQLKSDVLKHAEVVAGLTIHERAALLEEAYTVDDRGVVRVQPRFMPLLSAIRLVVSIVKRYRPGYEVDFNHRGWSNLRLAVEVRNRLVHPKAMEDLSVSDEEIQQSLSGFYWLVALCVEALSETKQHLEELRSYIPAQRGEANE